MASVTKIYLDLVKGDDKNTGDIDKPCKTIDKVYSEKRKVDQGRLIFTLTGGDQVLGLSEYQNCFFLNSSSTQPSGLLIKNAVKLTDVNIMAPIYIILDPKATGSIITATDVIFTPKSSIKVSEEVPNKKGKYPSVVILDIISGISELKDCFKIVEVDRSLTLIKRKKGESQLSLVLPMIECQGGILLEDSFNDSPGEFSGGFLIEDTKSNIKINPSVVGYFGQQLINDFLIAKCTRITVVRSSIIVTLPSSFKENQELFRTKDIKCECAYLSSNLPTRLYNFNDLIPTSMGINFIKIDTELKNIEHSKATSRIKTLNFDYTLDDTDGDIFHIEFLNSDGAANNTITVTIPDNLKIGTRTLFFKKLKSQFNNKLVIQTKKCHDVNDGTIIMNHTKNQLELYQDDFTFYIKNIS